MSKLSRRDFLGVSAGLAIPTPYFWVQSSTSQPRVIASGNGLQFKNGGTESCVELAYRLMMGGTDVLDAIVEGVSLNELDPGDMSVGYGGLPNANGVVQLDSCCMHGPRKWAGGVAALEGIRTPAKVAKAVASTTDHHLLVGPGAQDFARAMGFSIEGDLNTEGSRKAWLEWKRRTDPTHYLDPEKRAKDGLDAALAMAAEGLIDREHVFGTIHCNAINPKGDVAAVTTTSGLAFKIPGRVGDSPILGAGLYCDNAIGAAGSTGRGEANLYNLCSYLIVEEMRRGAHPKDAGMTALKRVADNTEKRLRNESGRPSFGLNFYIQDKKGRFAGVVMSGRSRYAVCDEGGARFVDAESLF